MRYAGLVFDLLGTFVSHMFVPSAVIPYIWAPSFVGLMLTLASYVLLRKAYGKETRLAAIQ